MGFLRDFAQLPNIVTGLALLLVIVFMPGGLAQVFPRRPGLRTGSPAEGGSLPRCGGCSSIGRRR